MSGLTSLPDIDFIEVDAEKITNDIIAVYEALAERSLYPGDPIRLFLTALAQIIIQQRVLINQTALKNLLRYASGDVLDHMGAFYKVPRLEAQAARTTQQFVLSAALSTATLIRAGTGCFLRQRSRWRSLPVLLRVPLKRSVQHLGSSGMASFRGK